MKRLILLLTFLMITTLVISGCAVSQTGSTATAVPSSTPAVTPTANDVVVTLADNGQTIQLRTGANFLLKLGNEYTWDITLSNPDVISLRKGVLVILGAQGIYDAIQPGTVQLTATGDPVCRQSVPACSALSILFSVTIDVSQ